MSIAALPPDVARAVELLQEAFPGRIHIEAYESSGPILRITDVILGAAWSAPTGDLWCAIPFHYPDAAIYPYYITSASPRPAAAVVRCNRSAGAGCLLRRSHCVTTRGIHRATPPWLLVMQTLAWLQVSWNVVLGAGDFARAASVFFRADQDEHGALLLAGEHPTADGGLLLCVREVHLLGPEEFPPGEHGYRQLAASALARVGNRAADEGLALVSAHSHPISDDRTGLSVDDLAAHERIFGHLLDITAAGSVTGVAFGRRSAAGETWHRDRCARHPLDQVRVVGANIEMLQFRDPCERRRRLVSGLTGRYACSAAKDRLASAVSTLA